MIIIHENEHFQALIEELEELSLNLDEEELFSNALAQLDAIAEEQQDKILKTVVLYHKSDLPYKYLKLEECRRLVQECLQLCKEIDSSYFIMRCYNILAILDSEESDYYSSITNYLSAYHIAQAHPEYQYSCIFLNNIGNLFVWLNEHEIAIEYLLNSHNEYYNENINSHYVLGLIVLNIIEEYSLMGQFDKLESWIHLDITSNQDIIATKKMILEINTIERFYQQHDFLKAQEHTKGIIETVDPVENFIYVFRGYMRLFKLSIDYNDKINADYLLSQTEVMDKNAVVTTFRYDFALLKYEHYMAFEAQSSKNTHEHQLLQEYVEGSRNVIDQMRNTYTRRLIIESELLKAEHDKEVALNQSLKLQKDIELDYFTKILNKVSIEKYIDLEISTASQDTKQALLFIDIDHFKDINDNFGHNRGDELILEVVNTISTLCNKDMLFGRFGGDEFLLFIKNVRNDRYIDAIVTEIIESGRQIQVNEDLHLTFSIGVYILQEDKTSREVLQKADSALYIAKKQGRDRYSIYKD